MIVPKKPIKKLPTSVEVTDKTTVQDVKENLARRAGGWDPNRFGLYEPEKKKLLKDRRALISQQQSILSGKEILVKDLGMCLSAQFPTQSGNTTIFGTMLIDGM
jgi:very-long-chain enoyl-CoA reductase